jgi:hypothetical protein
MDIDRLLKPLGELEKFSSGISKGKQSSLEVIT